MVTSCTENVEDQDQWATGLMASWVWE